MLAERHNDFLQRRHREQLEECPDRRCRCSRREGEDVVAQLKVPQWNADDRADFTVSSKIESVDRREYRRFVDRQQCPSRNIRRITKARGH